MDDSKAGTPSPHSAHRKICARRGCSAAVKKPTAKYCSVRCCSIDPERLEKLREQARRSGGRPVLPLARQLQLSFNAGNPEEALNVLCQGREDVPAGMSRLAV